MDVSFRVFLQRIDSVAPELHDLFPGPGLDFMCDLIDVRSVLFGSGSKSGNFFIGPRTDFLLFSKRLNGNKFTLRDSIFSLAIDSSTVILLFDRQSFELFFLDPSFDLPANCLFLWSSNRLRVWRKRHSFTKNVGLNFRRPLISYLSRILSWKICSRCYKRYKVVPL